QAYPTPHQAMAAPMTQIKEVLRQARHPNPTAVATTIFERLHQPHLQADAVMTRAKSRLMLALVSQLLPLIEQIAQYDIDFLNIKSWRDLLVLHGHQDLKDTSDASR